MKSKVEKLTGTGRQVEIEMPKDQVDEVLEGVVEDIRKTAKIPGFRPGRAPLDLIRRNHKKDIMEEVQRRLVPRAYQQALEKHGLNPLSYPMVSDVGIGSSGAFTFKAKLDVYPDVEVKKYKGLKVFTQKISVADKETEDAVARLRGMHAEFVDIDRPLIKGDFGICDVETRIDGKVIAKKRENMWVEVDKEASLLGMGEELCGLKKGDKKEVKVTLPETYPDKKYAGQNAVFRVEIKETKEKKMPELNDDFAGKLGKENMEQVREEIKTQLIERKEAGNKDAMKKQILEQLLKKVSFDLPESMVTRQLKVLMEKAENDLKQKGVDAATIGAQKEKLTEQILKEAKNKVKVYFILDEIAKREGIETSQEEVDTWLRSLAVSYDQSFDDVKKYYEEHDLVNGLKEQLREEKALDFILGESVITEKK